MDPWYATVAQTVSHLFLFPAIYVAIVARNACVTAICIATLLASFTYHLCLSTGACLLDANASTWQFVDHEIAHVNMIIPFILVVQGSTTRLSYSNLESKKDRKRLRDSAFWGELYRYLALLFAVGIVTISRLASGAFGGSQINVAMVIVIGLSAGILTYLLLVTKGAVLMTSTFDARYFVPGLVLLGAGVAFFLISAPDLYWVFHSLWHFCSFTAWTLLIIGTNAHAFPALTGPTRCGGCASTRLPAP
jgi:hypothetical protein